MAHVMGVVKVEDESWIFYEGFQGDVSFCHRGVFKVSRTGNNLQNVQHVDTEGELLCSLPICQEVH